MPRKNVEGIEMKKKMLALMLAGTMMVALIAGCGSKSDADNDTASETEKGQENQASDSDKPFAGQSITFTDTGAGDWEEYIKPIIAKFEEETGATVTMELYAHTDYLEMLDVKLGAGSSDYDVIGVDVPLVASYASKDFITPVDEYFSDDEKAIFTESALTAGSWDGEFYSPAMNSSSQLLWYNTALLKEAGVEVPESDTENRLTWEQVEGIAKEALAVVDADGNKGISGIAFEQVSRTYQMNMLPNSMGGANIGDDGFTVDGIINSEEWINACTWYQNLYSNGISLKGLTADDTGDIFKAGKIVFMVAGTWTAEALEKEGMSDYDYAPVPAFEGYEDKVGTPTGSWHFGIPKNSENKELAAEFIKYMSIGEGNTLWLETHGDVPSTTTGVENILKSDTAEKYMKIAAYEAANTAVPRALTPGYNEYDSVIESTWDDIKNGADVKESLDGAVKQLESLLSKLK